MMFKVRWHRRALSELADIWTHADSAQRQAITLASSTLDQRLSHVPYQEGESRTKGRRITFVPPLVTIFRIETDEQTVSVLQVRLFRKRKP